MTKVSVIVPNYNHAKFLPQRLDSILNQTFQDFEVILLDDFSTDNSREILEQYANHSKVTRIVFNEQNSGSTFRQWDKGLKLAKGEFIWIAESDDWCENTFLETLLPNINDKQGLVYCRSMTYDESTRITTCAFWPDDLEQDRWKNDFSSEGINEIHNYLVYKNTIPNASACLFRKDLAEFTDTILNMKFCGDWIFWMNILLQTNLYYCATPLNTFRYSLSTTRSKKSALLEKKRIDEYFHAINQAYILGRRKDYLKLEKLSWIEPWIFFPLFRNILPHSPPIPIEPYSYFILFYRRLLGYLKNRILSYLSS